VRIEAVIARISNAQRRARLGARHHLAAPAATVEDAVRGPVVLHATDPATVYLSARARMESCKLADVDRALYEKRTVIRWLGMRRTLFIVPVELLPVVQAACSRAVAARERRRLIKILEEAGIAADGDAWLRRAEQETLAALEARGEAVAAQLSADVPALHEQIHFGAGKKWAGTFSTGTRVLIILAAEGRIVRGRPRGSWISSQYRWTTLKRWLPDGIAELPIADAQAQLARHWLAAFGPGTAEDLKWWAGWTLAETRRALAAVDAVEVQLDDGATGLVLRDDLEPVADPPPWVALLPTLDATVMGWSQREWYLGRHKAALFDSAGNAGPTVWCDGRIVGGWAIRDDGEVVFRLFDDIGAEASAAVEREAERLTGWLASVRVIPRFRTPLERELTA
jgi:hypothetical protein